jgi:lipopolysaccharide transport system ATP-binding protein
MSNTVISVENLSKKYIIGHRHEQQRYTALRDVIVNKAKSVTKRVNLLRENTSNISSSSFSEEEFWALKDISFEIKQGDRVGIVGRNGAGKSTLLKVLSRITEPTNGRIKIRGRIASLLEVGTGFHPELTGRENTYLNGAILGMSKVEIHNRFDEIVEFAGVEKFLDTPVKHYSSGMYVRLAFAVAAHLEPEILIVDEVLAVGDAQFQKKCLGKMQEAASEGRTVIFVSHNMPSIKSFCNMGMMLDGGKVVTVGTAKETIEKYLNAGIEKTKKSTLTFRKPPNLNLWMNAVTLLCDGLPSTQLQMGGELALEIKFESTDPIRNPSIGFVIYSSEGESLLSANNYYQNSSFGDLRVEHGKIRCNLGMIPLMQGNYFISLWLSKEEHDHHYIERAISFEVVEHDIWGLGRVPSQNISTLWWPTNFQLLKEESIDCLSIIS